MSSSDKSKRIAIRRALTGEDRRVASKHLEQLPHLGPVIPQAEPYQANLEAELMRSGGYISYPHADALDDKVPRQQQRRDVIFPPRRLRYVPPTADG